MNKPEQASDEQTIAARAASNKRTLFIMLAVSIAPIALAYFTFFTGIGVPDSTTSHGEIINPALNVEPLFEDENRDFYAQLMKNKKWHLFIPVAETCDQHCQQILYVTRQVHIRLGEKSTRVERVLVHLSSAPLAQRMQVLQADHPLLRGVELSKSEWLGFMREGIKEADPAIQPYYLLVDQEGFAMMRYTAETSGGDLLKDLKRALKHSIDYQ